MFFCSYAQTPVYQFNFDNSLANATNTFSLQNNGVTEVYATDRFGIANNAIQFTSSNYLSSDIMTNLPSGSSSFSVSFWVKYSSTGASTPIFWGTNTNNQGFAIRELVQNSSSTNSNFLVNGGGTLNLSHNVNHFTFLNQWYFYTVTHSTTVGTAAPVTKIYRDGVLIKSQNVAERNIVLSNVFRIGAFQTPSVVAQMNGVLDDLRIYNVTLTDTEVQNLYTSSGLPTVLPPTISSISTSNFTPTSSSVNYTIQTNGATTSTVIRYGSASNNLNQFFTAPVTTSTSASYNEVITGLNPATTYFYRVESVNSGGTTFSAVNSFTTAANASIVQNGLIAYYSFENNFNNHNNLHELIPTISVPVRNVTSGKYGNGVHFNSANQQELVNTSSLNSVLDGSEFSICYWVYSLVDQGGLSNPTHFSLFGSGFMRQQPSSSYQTLFRGYAQGSANFRLLSDTNSGGLGQWQHIAVVHKAGTNAAREFEVFVNGIQLSSYPAQATIQNLFKINSNFYLGGGGSTTQFFNGNIDELYIYNRALNTTEINYIKDYYDVALNVSDFEIFSNDVFVYPNPVETKFKVESKEPIKFIEIFTMDGRKVITSSESLIDLSSMPNGMYQIKVTKENNKIEVKKILKK